MTTSEIDPTPTPASEPPTNPVPKSHGSSGGGPVRKEDPSNVSGGNRIIDSLFRRLGFDLPGRWIALLSLFVLVDIVILSWIQIQAYHAYYTFSQDFGSLNQAFYTAASTNRLFYYTSNLPAGTNGTFFAVHFSPLLFLLLPFYAIAAGPPTLLVMKVTGLALGAFPVFGLAHRRLGSPVWGFLLGMVYLLSPLTMTVDWISFDLEVFLPLFVLAAFYFLNRERTVPFLAFLVLALATIETIAPLLAVFAGLALLGTFFGPKLLDPAHRNRLRLFFLGILVLIVVWYVMAGEIVGSFSPVGGTYGAGYAGHYTVLGATTFFDVIPQAILHPNLAGAALSYSGGQKLAYVLLLFGSLAFLPIFGEVRYSLPVGGWLVLALLSNFPGMYSFGSQYLGYVDPFLFAGAIGGIVYLRQFFTPTGAASSTGSNDPGRRKARARAWSLRADEAILPGTLIFAVAVTVAIANPLLANPVAGLRSVQYGVASPDPHTELLDRIIALIPKSASVLTTPHLFPQVSNRLGAYVLPTAQLYAGTNTYWGSLNQFINSSSYVLLDFVLDSYTSELMQFFGNYSAFGLLASGDGIFLLERGWTGGPLPGFWSVTTNAFSGASVAANPSLVVASNQTLFFRASSKANQSIWTGPTIARVIPGEYNVTVYYAMKTVGVGPAFNFRLSETPIDIVPVPYLNNSIGRHYQYVFQRAPTALTLAETNVSGPANRIGYWTPGAVSLTVGVSQLANLESLGVTDTGRFSLYVLGITVTSSAPPTEWVSST